MVANHGWVSCDYFYRFLQNYIVGADVVMRHHLSGMEIILAIRDSLNLDFDYDPSFKIRRKNNRLIPMPGRG